MKHGNATDGDIKGVAGNRLKPLGALCAVGLCGLAGVLVDIDHIVPIFCPQYRWVYGRILHAPLFAISGIAICYMGTYVRGLRYKLVLIAVAVITALVLAYSPWVNWDLVK